MNVEIKYTVRNGRTYVSYFFNGERASHMELEGLAAAQACKYRLALKEAELALHMLLHASSILQKYLPPESSSDEAISISPTETDNVLMHALIFAATISYAKLFRGTGKGRKKFTVRDFYLTGDGKKFFELHKWWSAYRDEYVAHAMNANFDYAQLLLLLPAEIKEGRNWFQLYPSAHHLTVPDRYTLLNLIELCKYVSEELSKSLDRIVNNIFRNLQKEELQQYLKTAVIETVIPEFRSAPTVKY